MTIHTKYLTSPYFSIPIDGWDLILRGMSIDFESSRHDPGREIQVLKRENENYHALYEVKQMGMYHLYRNLCGSAVDFNTAQAVIDTLTTMLEAGDKINVEVSPQSGYSYRMIEGLTGFLIGPFRPKTRPVTYRFCEVLVNFPISLTPAIAAAEAVNANLNRWVTIEDLLLKSIYRRQTAANEAAAEWVREKNSN